MAAIPTPCKDLHMDHWGKQITFTAGQKSLWPNSPFASYGQSLSWIYTISPMDINYVLSALNTQKPTGWTLGKSKAIMNSYEMGITVHNPSNVPIRVVLNTLKCRRDQNYEPGVSATTCLRDDIQRWFDGQYGSTATAIGIEYTAFKLSALASFTYNWRIVKKRIKVIQPGQSMYLRKFRRRPKLYNTAELYDSLTSPFIKKRALKGDLHYLWEVEPQITKDTANASIKTVTGSLDFLYKIHMRMSYFANDTYSSDPSTAMSSDVSTTNIMPTQVNTVGVSWATAN